jgi:hypothetical protein
MPFEQLRALVVRLKEPEPEPEDHHDHDHDHDHDTVDEPVNELDTQPTGCRSISPGRASTLDDLIASLRAATAASNDTSRTRPRKRM